MALGTQKIIDRTKPRQIEQLWLELLNSSWGLRFLDLLDLNLSHIVKAQRVVDCDFDQIMYLAGFLSDATGFVGIGCAEILVGCLLQDRGSLLALALERKGHQIQLLLDEFRQMSVGKFSPVSRDEICPRIPAPARQSMILEKWLLEGCAHASKMVDSWLTTYEIALCALPDTAIKTREWTLHSIQPEHLAWACLSLQNIKAWMRDVGVTENRLESAFRSTLPHGSAPLPDIEAWMGPVAATLTDIVQRFQFFFQYENVDKKTPARKAWLNLAMEEARLLGYQEVNSDHLMLGILSDPEGQVVRTLQSHGVDVKALRRRLSIPRSSNSTQSATSLSQDLVELCLAMYESGGNDSTHPGEWVLQLLDFRDYPEIPKGHVQKILRQRLAGTLSRNIESVGIDGIRLGMSQQEVETRLGSPPEVWGRQWHYNNRSVVIDNGVVVWVDGARLFEGQTPVLSTGDTLDRAEAVLGFRYQVIFDNQNCASARVFLGRVQTLTLGPWTRPTAPE